MTTWLRDRYGAGPLHLLAIVGGLAVAIYASWRLLPRAPFDIAVWLVGAPLVHDVVLVPVYTAVAIGLVALARRIGHEDAVNHVRIPALLSALLFLVFLPLILRRPPSYERFTGFTTDPFLDRWLAITGGLFLLSAACYAIRLRAYRRRVG